MSESIDKELLVTLAEEIKEYLPKIIDKIEGYKKDPGNVQELRDAHRYTHTVKGASSMVGLSELSHLGYHMENAIEEVLLGQLEIPPKLVALIYEAVSLIDEYIDRLLSNNNIDVKQLFNRLTQQFTEIRDQLREKNGNIPREKLFFTELDELDDDELIGLPQQEAVESIDKPQIITPALSDEMAEFIEAFLPEATELLQNISANLAALINNPTDKELIEEFRRPVHTLKGAAGLVKFQTIYLLSFHTQKLLEYLYENAIIPSEEIFSLFSWYIEQTKGLMEKRELEVVHLSDEYSVRCEKIINDLKKSKIETINKKLVPAATQELTQEDIEEATKELMEAFLIEAQEHWQNISQSLTNLAQQPSDSELLQEVRRHIHTLKGAANMTGFTTIGKLTHRMEDLLDYLYDNQIALSKEVIDLLFSSSDAIEGFITEKQDKDISSLTDLFAQYQKILDGLTPFHPLLTPVLPTSPPSTLSTTPKEVLKDAQLKPEVVSSELMDAFVAEAYEYTQNISNALEMLANKPTDKELLKEVRRPVHTLKGAAAVVKFHTIHKLSLVIEELLDNLYEKNTVPSTKVINLLSNSLDTIENLIDSKQTNNLSLLEEILAQYQQLIGNTGIQQDAVNLLTIQSGKETEIKLSEISGNPSLNNLVKEDKKANASSSSSSNDRRRTERREQAGYVRVPIERLDEIIKLVGELVINRSSFEQYFGDFTRELDELNFSTNRMHRVSAKLESEYGVMALGGKGLTNINKQVSQLVQPVFLHNNSRTTTTSAYEFDELEFDRYTEFNVLLKELVETSTDMKTVGANLRNTKGDFDSYLNRLGRLTRETQDKLMQLRMVPVAVLASRLHRTVRTTAVQQQKSVELILEGEQIELDKTVLEEITDPLFHILRNAVDHGIEPPALRQALGKAEKGTIQLQAYYEGTYAVIRISDDGSGLNANLIRSTAINRGILSETEVGKMTDEELFSLIFLPGFSTAKEVSEISGRGVGMDIVKAKVQKMKGTITVSSSAGQGTNFTIKLPMTLAITRVLTVNVGKDTFAIPLSVITHIFRIESSNIQLLGDKQVIKAQNEIYPLVLLSDLLDLTRSSEALEKHPILIINLGERKIALAVDSLQEQREVVVKNLGSHLRRLHGITGGTLMGDGSVVLILNLAELLENIVGHQETQKAPTMKPKQLSQKQEVSLSKPSEPFEMPVSFRQETQEAFQEEIQPKTPNSELEAKEALPLTFAEISSQVVKAEVPKKDSLTVFIVDDSLSVRTVISNLIKKTGWTAITAKDGMDALQMLQQAKELPDILLVDIEMPRMDGYELTSALKGQETYKHLPIVMLTSRAGGKHRQRAIDIGVDEYLIKPYQDEVLLSTIKRLTKFE